MVPLGVEAPLRAPVFSPDKSRVLALSEESHQLMRLEVEETSGGLLSSGKPRIVTEEKDLEGAGENMALTPTENQGLIFVPQPDNGQVQIIEDDDLLDVLTFNAGKTPARVALGGSSLGRSSPTLFVLSEDGSTVTAVSIKTYDTIGDMEVDGGRNTLLEAPHAGDGRVFWTAGPEGVALHQLGSGPQVTPLKTEAATLAADYEKTERAYASEAGRGRLAAVEPNASGEERRVE